ncbi:hypothetical protein QUF80_06180 [Desulfococcaceae bacterium HSG8]|nr:hypothetical protein [Desulfococcaceae bacterium HSG8]
MTKIQEVVREIENLQDFYKKTKLLRTRIKSKNPGRGLAEAAEKETTSETVNGEKA